jgi:hypothetical protein
MPQSRQFQAFFNDGGEVHILPMPARAALTDFSRTQYLFHRAQKAICVIQHQAIKIAPLVVIQRAPFQRLQVKPYGRDRRFEFMGDRVEKAVLLFVSAYLSHQENRVEDKPGNDHAEKDDAQNQRHHIAPVVHQPYDVEINRQPHQAGAQRNKKCDCPGAASDAHGG